MSKLPILISFFLRILFKRTPLLSENYCRIFSKLMKRLRKLESYKDYMTIKRLVPDAGWLIYPNASDFPKMPQIKHLEIIYSAAKEW